MTLLQITIKAQTQEHIGHRTQLLRAFLSQKARFSTIEDLNYEFKGL